MANLGLRQLLGSGHELYFTLLLRQIWHIVQAVHLILSQNPLIM